MAAAMLMLVSVALPGCTESESHRRAEELRRQTAHTTQISLDEVIETFNQLYDFVNLELEPPVAVLDNRKTYDGQDALARFGRNPATPDAGFSNFLTLTSRNAPLKQLGVKPGDQVRYYIRLDEDRDVFVEEIGMADFQAVEMVVAQVVDEQHLIVEGHWPPVETEDAYRIEIWRNVDDQVREIHSRLGAYAEYATPPLAWQPAPDEIAIEQALNRLNQWMRHNHEPKAIEPPPLLATLPTRLRESPRLRPYLSPEALGAISFSDEEGRLLQQAVWLRNISNWARGDAVGDVELAAALFDWTVRHIQLEKIEGEETAHHLARHPWEILLYGEGTAEQRAWIFALLCQQQGLPAVVLEVARGEDETAQSQFWCVGVLSKGEIYLFDPALGLPIPGPDGEEIATLKQAVENPDVLRQLDLDNERSYPWSPDDLQQVTAGIVASPQSLSRRAALLQKQLVGQSGFVISVDPALLVEALDGQPHVQAVELWSWPFEVLDRKLAMSVRQGERAAELRRQRIRAALRDFRVFALQPHLWKARVLHFRGPDPEAGTTRTESNDPDRVDGHREAIGLYQAARAADREMAAERSDEKRRMMGQARQDATYWLGLLKIDQEDYRIALTSWLPQVMTADPASPWLDGARYNLARAHEALGQVDQAIALYEKDDSPQQYGNQLRARRLREREAQAAAPKAP